MKSPTRLSRLGIALMALVAVSLSAASVFASCEKRYLSSIDDERGNQVVAALGGVFSAGGIGTVTVLGMQDAAAHGERVATELLKGKRLLAIAETIAAAALLYEHLKTRDRREVLALLEEAGSGDGPHLRRQYDKARTAHPSLDFDVFRAAIRTADDQNLFCSAAVGSSGLYTIREVREWVAQAPHASQVEGELRGGRLLSSGTQNPLQASTPVARQGSKSAD